MRPRKKTTAPCAARVQRSTLSDRFTPAHHSARTRSAVQAGGGFRGKSLPIDRVEGTLPDSEGRPDCPRSGCRGA